MAPAAPEPPGNIRVFVRWHDQTVFAGEDVRCRITFKNVAPAHGANNAPKASPHLRHTGGDRARQASPLHGPARPKPSPGLAPPAAARGHRSSLSLTVPSPRSRHRADSAPWSPPAPPETRPPGNGHRRSVSIVSIGSAGSPDQAPASPASPPASNPRRGHGRASSLQIASRSSLANGPRSGPQPNRSFSVQPSPLFNSSFPSDQSSSNGRPSGASTVPNTPSIGGAATSPGSEGDEVAGFAFPLVQSPASDAKASPQGPYPEAGADPAGPPAPRNASVPTIHEHNVRPAARVLSTTSVAGTPRSSGEFYSLSNNSTETLASEYVTHQPPRTQAGPAHLRPRSTPSSQKARQPEALMMGYAQVQGSFTLDGSLVNLDPFEQVKRKGVVGGQGGGVVGVESTKRESGLLRGFGWGNITSSIGELLGGGELSSIKDMRGLAGAKSVPLLSTPQSILFVDLQLGPGESRSFEYVFRLPKGLPPTHRGKAMKIAYGLVIGTQRPGGAREQQVRSVEIPFRVLGSVNSHGEILGHDLMAPYILLRDQARVRGVDKAAPHEARHHGQAGPPEATLASFLAYADDLLRTPRAGAGDGTGGGLLLSPTAPDPDSRRASFFDEARTAREAIDLAILRSNLTAEGQQSANRFEIARNGRRVGVVMLARPSYRLGEAVTLAVDFAGAEVPCYAVHAALETAERVDPGLALRSEASVHRVTRRVYASSSEAALFARRLVFAPSIPTTATPEFVTSGVSLEWKVRLEFVVPTQPDPAPETRAGGGDDDYDDDGTDGDESDDADGPSDDTDATPEPDDRRRPRNAGEARRPPPSPSSPAAHPHPLLEEVSRDDRGGLVLVAVENLSCESFEVAVPLRVYGAATTGLERLERDAALDEGLVV